jgi:hypothetical protein
MKRNELHHDGARESHPYGLLFIPTLEKWEKRNNPFALRFSVLLRAGLSKSRSWFDRLTTNGT